MRQLVLSPDRFAAWFHSMVPGAYRIITAQDIRDMTRCGLIGRYGYYGRSDIEIVRAVLQYEQLREDRVRQANYVRVCKRCGAPLPDNAGRGRPKEYCSECESFRSRERWRRWYQREKQGVNLFDGGDGGGSNSIVPKYFEPIRTKTGVYNQFLHIRISTMQVQLGLFKGY